MYQDRKGNMIKNIIIGVLALGVVGLGGWTGWDSFTEWRTDALNTARIQAQQDLINRMYAQAEAQRSITLRNSITDENGEAKLGTPIVLVKAQQ